MNTELWNESLESGGQQFDQYQENEQSTLNSKSKMFEKFKLRTPVYSKQKSVFHLDWFHCMKLQEFYIELFLKHYKTYNYCIFF